MKVTQRSVTRGGARPREPGDPAAAAAPAGMLTESTAERGVARCSQGGAGHRGDSCCSFPMDAWSMLLLCPRGMKDPISSWHCPCACPSGFLEDGGAPLLFPLHARTRVVLCMRVHGWFSSIIFLVKVFPAWSGRWKHLVQQGAQGTGLCRAVQGWAAAGSPALLPPRPEPCPGHSQCLPALLAVRPARAGPQQVTCSSCRHSGLPRHSLAGRGGALSTPRPGSPRAHPPRGSASHVGNKIVL